MAPEVLEPESLAWGDRHGAVLRFETARRTTRASLGLILVFLSLVGTTPARLFPNYEGLVTAKSTVSSNGAAPISTSAGVEGRRVVDRFWEIFRGATFRG